MLDPRRIKAIGLDLDDTLWPIWPAIARADRCLVAWLEPQAPGAARDLADGERRQALRKALLEAQPGLVHDVGAQRREIIRAALRQCDEDTTLAEPAFEVFLEARMRVDLFPDSLPALEWLSARYPIVAISNGNADVHRVGIGAHFAASLSAHRFGVGKPDRRIFEAAADVAGVAPDAVLHIGDDAELDVRGALDAGMQTAWVNRDGQAWPHAWRAHAEVADMAAVCRLLQAR